MSTDLPRTIIVQPLTDFSYKELRALEKHLVEKLGGYGFNVIISPTRLQPPLQFFDWHRRQYKSWLFLGWLHKMYSNMDCLVLGIADIDAYVPGLNFVFGHADPVGRVAMVYTKRLRATQSDDANRFLSRLRKEALHELGHLLGLQHCPNRECVMSFSNSLEEVDSKSDDFCRYCRKRLDELYGLKLK